MMNEGDIADWVSSLSKNERQILATYEGGNCMPESIERYWNAKALENLITQGIVTWTMQGYELSEDGVLLAGYIDNMDNQRKQKSSKNTGKRMKFGAPCPRCGNEVVKIKRETLNHIIDFLSPAFHSVSDRQINGKQKYIPICPSCDVYALGIELSKGFPFILINGQESEIHQIADLLWQPGKPFRSKNIEITNFESEDG